MLVHYHSLSPLDINQAIKKKVRLLHRMYQGAQMLDLDHSCFSVKVLLLQDFLNSDSTLVKMLNVALDTFIVDTGLGDNIFTKSYSSFGSLATKGWFQHLWELADFLNVSVHMKANHRVQAIQRGNTPFTEKLIARNQETKTFT